MPSERLPEPWQSFLAEVDRAASQDLDLHCIGGFAVTLRYGLTRPTGDIDVAHVVPNEAAAWLAKFAGEGSALHLRFKVYVQIVTIANLPYLYEERLTEMFAGSFQNLRLFVLDSYDLVLSKLTRNLEVDLEDAKYLARTENLDLGILEERYRSELRPYVMGPPEKHDLTLDLWLEVIREERADKANK
jgi:Nucleotidyltransferase of unknown function (DUF6036)